MLIKIVPCYKRFPHRNLYKLTETKVITMHIISWFNQIFVILIEVFTKQTDIHEKDLKNLNTVT